MNCKESWSKIQFFYLMNFKINKFCKKFEKILKIFLNIKNYGVIFLNNLNLYLRGMNRDDTHNERAGRDTEKFY